MVVWACQFFWKCPVLNAWDLGCCECNNLVKMIVFECCQEIVVIPACCSHDYNWNLGLNMLRLWVLGLLSGFVYLGFCPLFHHYKPLFLHVENRMLIYLLAG